MSDHPEWATALSAGNSAHRRRALIAGSRRLPRGHAARLLIRFLADLPDDAVVLVRGRAAGGMGPFEREVVTLCRAIHIAYQVCAPWPISDDDPYIGREGVLQRDRTMVELADVVLAFVTADDMESKDFSGTRHLVETALNKDKSAFLYSISREGAVSQVGQNDPTSAWSEKVPQA